MAELQRRSFLHAVNPERKAKLYERNYGEKADWIRSLPCLVCGARPCDAAHVKSRGAGGTSADLVPLCHAHHMEQHAIGVCTFEARYDVDLTLEAHDFHSQWESQWEREAAA